MPVGMKILYIAQMWLGRFEFFTLLVLVFVVAAILTPPDVFSQLALAIPGMLLYEASIYSVRMVEKKRAEEEAAAQQ